jgi:hypothetical protein
LGRFVGLTQFSYYGTTTKYSDDGGVTWNTVSVPTFDNSPYKQVTALRYHNGIFIATYRTVVIISPLTYNYGTCKSSDGINWTAGPSSTVDLTRDFSYYAGLYFTSSGSYVYTSPDALNWTQGAYLPLVGGSPLPVSMFSYAFLLDPAGNNYVSSDLINWALCATPALGVGQSSVNKSEVGNNGNAVTAGITYTGYDSFLNVLSYSIHASVDEIASLLDYNETIGLFALHHNLSGVPDRPVYPPTGTPVDGNLYSSFKISHDGLIWTTVNYPYPDYFNGLAVGNDRVVIIQNNSVLIVYLY